MEDRVEPYSVEEKYESAVMARELTVRVEATEPLPRTVNEVNDPLEPFKVDTVSVEAKEPLEPFSVDTKSVEPIEPPEATCNVEPVRVEKDSRPETEREETSAVELTVSVLTTLEATVKVDCRVKVEAERLFNAKSLVHSCRPLVETVNTYPLLTKEPSGL